MKYQNYTVDILHAEGMEVVNSFINCHRVLLVTKNLLKTDNGYVWNFLIEYNQSENSVKKEEVAKPKVDYREVLTPADFEVFSKLREVRKKLAEKSGIPVYAVFTNEQLAEIVVKKITSKTALAQLNGVGEQKLREYAEAILSVMKEATTDKI